MSNIFDLSLEYLQIIDELEESGGELTEGIEDRLNINQNEMAEKLDNYRLVIAIRLKENMAKAVNLYGTLTKTNNKTFASTFGKYTLVHSKPLAISSDLILTPNDKELQPYLKATYTIKSIGENIIDMEAFLANAAGVTKVYDLDKTAIKKAINEAVPTTDEEGNEVIPFADKVWIDENAAWLKIT